MMLFFVRVEGIDLGEPQATVFAYIRLHTWKYKERDESVKPLLLHKRDPEN
jgi:hypothetical protein